MAEVAPPVEDSQDDGGKLFKHLIVKYEVPIQNVELKFFPRDITHLKIKTTQMFGCSTTYLEVINGRIISKYSYGKVNKMIRGRGSKMHC